MKNNRQTLLRAKQAFALALLIIFSAIVSAQESDQKGMEIAKERKLRDLGWEDTVADMTMVLRNSQSQQTERKMRTKALEVLDDGDKTITIFDEPRDVSGTAFLNFSHATVPDDQWIYLPALKRVKRISSRNKSGPFMGSEFAYEDMTTFEVEKYTFKYLSDDQYKDRDMFVLEQYPVDEFSGYTKQKVWVDKERYVPYKIEFYDRKGSLLKTLEMSDYKQYLDKYWRPHRAEMFNEQNGKSTELITHTIEFKTGLKDGDFDKNSLKRAR
ncbi:outer membrane lipoprotein-sorting protein [Aliiglaciecola sp. LCG003]|uniref:outer membrane lipoprotein-sorting protein n=1 Tax=Aliiglaciecola sp. LCG003 TaxID=3053655 RepID=UPI002572B19F|nr:outer membrane lipoprotein-sorting protein [Aliiglaciecola sp. LCG003]WJG08474.1 outer membrane lipoprotein-sorting protein [Aliiglaciecola sp. LCG003]